MPPPRLHPLEKLYSRPGYLLRRAHQLSVAIFERECESLGITPAQYSLLSVLRRAEGLDQATVARALGFDKVTVLRVVRGMEERKLIVRRQAENDRRSVLLSLSERGRTLYDRAQKPVDVAYSKLVAPLTAKQRDQLVDLLGLLTTELEEHARAPLMKNAVADAEAA